MVQVKRIKELAGEAMCWFGEGSYTDLVDKMTDGQYGDFKDSIEKAITIAVRECAGSLRVPHDQRCLERNTGKSPWGCICIAEKHNAAIEAALKG